MMMEPQSASSSRFRTTSEGTPLGQGRRAVMVNPMHAPSGSPLSPSPGSYISSESAGSSNSIDDADYHVPDRRHGSQQAAYEQPAPATIIEESSAESWVDPNANNCYPPPPPQISHSRTHSGPVIGVQYTPVECGGNQAGSMMGDPDAANPGELIEGGTHYSSLVSNANPEGSSEYMAMSPPNATPSTRYC